MTNRPLLLDCFCCAGGATKGYQNAGFFVVGIDIKPQKHYCGDAFILGDALDILARMIAGEKFLASDGRWYGLADFAAIHASPPCQGYSQAKAVHKKNHPLLIGETRTALENTRKFYVIENVENAPLRAQIMLCGSMFSLGVIRHRWFESNISIGFPPFSCQCHRQAVLGNMLNYHNTKQRDLYISKHGNRSGATLFKEAMGVEWMNFDESQEAIPPAYCEFIGKHLLAHLYPSAAAFSRE